MISQYLVPMIQDRFPGKGVYAQNEGSHVYTFPPQFEKYGPIEIHHDDDEVTIYLGRFTHRHFSNDEDGLTTEEKIYGGCTNNTFRVIDTSIVESNYVLDG